MNELSILGQNLPSTAEDLAKFILISSDRLAHVKAELSAIKHAKLASDVVEQKKHETQELAAVLLVAQAKLGEFTKQIPKQLGGDRKSEKIKLQRRLEFDPNIMADEDTIDEISERIAEKKAKKVKTKFEQLKDMGINRQLALECEQLHDNFETMREVVAETIEKGEIPTRKAVINQIRAEKKKTEILEAEKAVHEEATAEYKPYLTVGNSIGYVPAEKYDLLLTDPPYSTDVEDIDKFVDSWLCNALDNVKPTGFAYVFIGAYPEEVRAYLNAKTPEHISLCQQLIWTYKNTLGNNPKDRYKQNYQVCLFYRGKEAPDLDCPLTSEQWAVQEINAPDGRQGDRYHAWQKPMEIAERFVRHSTEQGMTVFDPFACTGTFLLAATKLGRKAYGFEIDPANAEIAFSRGCVKNE